MPASTASATGDLRFLRFENRAAINKISFMFFRFSNASFLNTSIY
ncbi:MAG TPA: hypothetical protein VMH01_02080 [Puia sp.]|nr:hypothetical protein [Puia sp.]